MITPAEIKAKALRKYRDVLRAALVDETIFPLTFPVGRLSSDLAARRQQIDTLRARAKETTGRGYTLRYVTVNRRDLGRQSEPKQVLIETQDDYLALLGKQAEFSAFLADATKICQTFPTLAEWVQANPQDVVDAHAKWDDLLVVCTYFISNPRPGLYLRELPVPVHTKFIERNTTLLGNLLDHLLAPDMVAADEKEFTHRYGLQEKASLVRLRLLDHQLDQRYGLHIDELALPVAQLAHLLAEHIQPEQVIIVENLINFLTVPLHPKSVALWGSGGAVHLLRDVAWLATCDVLYWGDIDVHGFQILSDIRGYFAHIRSVMMDFQTLDENRENVATGNKRDANRFDHLTEQERQVAQYVVEHDLRLEQEQIPNAYAVAKLKAALSLQIL